MIGRYETLHHSSHKQKMPIHMISYFEISASDQDVFASSEIVSFADSGSQFVNFEDDN